MAGEAAGPLRRIRRGSYLPVQYWEALYAGERHLALVHATAAKMNQPLPTFSFMPQPHSGGCRSSATGLPRSM